MGDKVAAAGDEQRLVVPAQWDRLIHPRRGAVNAVKAERGGEVRLPPAHTGSTTALEALYGDAADARVSVDNPSTLPRVVEPVRRQLSGQASPVGAAVLSLFATDDEGSDLPAHLDAWIAAYGLPFAVAATVEATRLGVQSSVRNFRACVYETGDVGLPRRTQGLARMLRTYLAAADDEAYAAAVRELEGHRGDRRQRVIVSYLVPTESAWLAETCAEVGKVKLSTREWRPLVALLHCSVSRPEELVALRKRGPFHPDHIDQATLVTAVAALGADVVGLLPAVLDSSAATVDVLRMTLDVVARIPCDEAFELLTSRLTKKHIQAAVIEAAERFPRRAIRLLARSACAHDGNSDFARNLLVGQLARHGELAAEVRPALTADERVLVDRLCLQVAGRPEAPIAELPPVLVNPPWTRKRPRKAPAATSEPAFVDCVALTAPALSRIAWKPGEREDFAQRRPRQDEVKPKDLMRTLDKIEEQGTSGANREDRFALLHAPEERARRLLPHLRLAFDGWDQIDAFGAILARFGTDAIGPVTHRPEGANLTGRAMLLQPIVDVRVARLMADWLLRLKSVRSQARTWLERHRADAAALLIPDALGADKELRPAAEGALRYLGGLGLDLVDVAQRVYGADAALAIKSIVEADPLDLVPARPPKLAAWLADAYLPQILLRDRRTALPAQSVRHVLTMLAISRPGEPYAGLEIVRDCTDPTSLAAFGRALLAAWRALNYPNGESWILSAQSVLGDAETVRDLVPLIRAWPRESAHLRAVAGLGVLIDFETDYARFHVHLLAQSSPKKAVNLRAQEKLASTAAKLDLTFDQWADRLMPDFGLDHEAALWLDYGPRRFRVRYDEGARPTILDESGSACPGGVLPEPAAEDDVELAEIARARLSALSEDIRTLMAVHALRQLESSMVAGRSWTAVEFHSLLLGHPLLWHLVCRVVWLCEHEGAVTAFRVAEDRGFADVRDEVFVLPERAVVRVAHPLGLGADLGAWAELFADYEILQPFVQLGRPVYALKDQERAGAAFTRFDGVDVPSVEVRGLLERGWEPPRKEAWFVQRFVRATRDGRWLILDFDPGIGLSNPVDDAPLQRLGAVVLGSARDGAEPAQGAGSSSLQGLDEISVSELLGDLHRLADH